MIHDVALTFVGQWLIVQIRWKVRVDDDVNLKYFVLDYTTLPWFS